jgi:short subunit dehydrogenase-like uncharacterized protein
MGHATIALSGGDASLMWHNILLYGATGYSGRLIAAEGRLTGMSYHAPQGDCRMILAARSGPGLSRVAIENAMDFRVFSLRDPAAILAGLDGIDVVINAAGPFAFTAVPLAKAAIIAGCHYVDINGELDVYLKLRNLADTAEGKKVVMVSAAGASGAASELLVDWGLRQVLRTQTAAQGLGAIRVGHSKEMDVSRGTAATLARSLCEEVVVVRASGPANPTADYCLPGEPSGQMVIRYVPVGELERLFDFGAVNSQCKDSIKNCGPRIASALSLVDTLTSRDGAQFHGLIVRTIESYEEMGTISRFAYQTAAKLSSLCALPPVRALTEAQLCLLPDGPTRKELDEGRHAVVLEIEDIFGVRTIDWLMQTPNVYQFTAQLAVAIAGAVAHREGADKMGWTTAADALGPVPFGVGALRGCTLHQRTG